MDKSYEFTYRICVQKFIELKEYNSPHHDTKEAELDIETALRQLDLKDKLKEGLNYIEFEVKYVPQNDGYYYPHFYAPKIFHEVDDSLVINIKKPPTTWQKIKRFFKKLKVKRG